MKVYVYPADVFGCGHHRLIWPSEILASTGHDVSVVLPKDRSITVEMDTVKNVVVDTTIPKDADVVVFQRTTHSGVPGIIDWCTKQGIATVIEIDDDLSSIHPSNGVAKAVNLTYDRRGKPDVSQPLSTLRHSWRYLERCASKATVVMCASPGLAQRYGGTRPARVIENYIHDSYYGHTRVDSDHIVWPANIGTHPNDPSVVGQAIRQLVDDGVLFSATSGDTNRVGRVFGLNGAAGNFGEVQLADWPAHLAKIGIGIIPLAKSKFNRSKSWLKGAELSAVGVPWVASPRPEYQALNDLGAGTLADSPAEWHTYLRALVGSASLRQEHSERNRAVAESLRMRDNVWRWWAVWTEAKALMDRGKVPVPA